MSKEQEGKKLSLGKVKLDEHNLLNSHIEMAANTPYILDPRWSVGTKQGVFSGLGWVRRCLSGWIRRSRVGVTTFGMGICCRWVGLAALGWICRSRFGFVAVSLDLSRSVWICCSWVGFTVVGHDSQRCLVVFALAALVNYLLLVPLADIAGTGFAIAGPNCQCSVHIVVGLVGCNCNGFSLARAEELIPFLRVVMG